MFLALNNSRSWRMLNTKSSDLICLVGSPNSREFLVNGTTTAAPHWSERRARWSKLLVAMVNCSQYFSASTSFLSSFLGPGPKSGLPCDDLGCAKSVTSRLLSSLNPSNLSKTPDPDNKYRKKMKTDTSNRIIEFFGRQIQQAILYVLHVLWA